eukprot:CFRG2381T1
MSVLRTIVVVFTLCALALVSVVDAKLKDGECEVCIGSLTKLVSTATAEDKKNVDTWEAHIKDWCNTHHNGGKEERFCYQIGALVTSATKTIKDVSKPLSSSIPPERVCEKLKKSNSAICELQYDKVIDISNPSKLRVKELKKVLQNWGEKCHGCAEKSDFVKKIEEVKHLHTEL